MDSPPTSTHKRVRNEMMSKKGVVSLKYRQGTFNVKTATIAPMKMVAAWKAIGPT